MNPSANQSLTDIVETYFENLRHVHHRSQQQLQQQATKATPDPISSLPPIVATSYPPQPTIASAPTPSPVKQRVLNPESYQIESLKRLKDEVFLSKSFGEKKQLLHCDTAPAVDIDEQLPVDLDGFEKAKRIIKFYEQLRMKEDFVKAMRLKACTRLFDLYIKSGIDEYSYVKQFDDLDETALDILAIGEELSIIQEFAGENLKV